MRPPTRPGTAESAWSDGKYLQVTGAATANWTIRPASRPRVLEAVIDRVPGTAAACALRRASAGSTSAAARAQGASAVPGRLMPVVVGTVPAGATTITATFRGGSGRVDALLLTPGVTVLRTKHVVVRDKRGGGFTVRTT